MPGIDEQLRALKEGRLILTDHCLERCRERRISPRAALPVVRHGRSHRSRDGKLVRHLDRYAAHLASQRGIDLYHYCGIAVVLAPGFGPLRGYWTAITVYRLSDGEAATRRKTRPFGHDEPPPPPQPLATPLADLLPCGGR